MNHPTKRIRWGVDWYDEPRRRIVRQLQRKNRIAEALDVGFQLVAWGIGLTALVMAGAVVWGDR